MVRPIYVELAYMPQVFLLLLSPKPHYIKINITIIVTTIHIGSMMKSEV